MAIDGMITAEQLRYEIGGPTTDTTEPGYIEDSALQAIIDRYAVSVEKILLERVDTKKAVLPLDVYEPVVIDTEASGFNGRMAEGRVDEKWFPFSRFATDDFGNELAYDSDIFVTATAAPFERRRFLMIGRRVFALPKTVEAVTLHLAELSEVVTRIGAELVLNMNNKMIAEGRAMLAARIAEQSRLVNDQRDS